MKITRRKFINLLSNFVWIIIGIFFIDFANEQLEKKRNLRTKKIINNDFENGVHSVDDFIIIKSQNKIRVFKASCTHLGCKVRQNGDGNLVCPCHGSKFNFEGKVLNGPASSPLEKIDFEFDKSKNQIILYVST